MTISRRDRFLLNPYRDWSKAQGIPIHEGFGIDLLGIETSHWNYYGANGAIVNLFGRGDYSSIHVIDIPEGGKTNRVQHLYEEIFYVLEGCGSTTFELANGTTRSMEWGRSCLFAVPLNCPYRIFNGSGRERTRLVSINDARITLKLYHNEDFVFRNSFRFSDRESEDNSFYNNTGDLQIRTAGHHTWETNVIDNLRELGLRPWEERGGSSSNIVLMMADGTMHAHVSEMPVGTYKKAHRHGPDWFVCCVRGQGFSIFWYEGQEDEQIRIDWKEGWIFAPADKQYHLHFNTGAEPCRYFAAALGSRRYPFNDDKELRWSGISPKALRVDDAQLEYDEQPSNCHLDFLIELERNGIRSKMGNEINEQLYLVQLEQLKREGKIHLPG